MSLYPHISIPPARHDESLHSVLVTAFRNSGYPNFDEFTELIFGRETDGRGWPWSYMRLVPYLSAHTAEGVALLDRMLTISYYVPFTPVDALQSCQSPESELNPPEMHLNFVFGSHALRKVVTPLRFCHVCAQQDVRHDGTSYWRRAHQLHDVNACWSHAVRLRLWRQPRRKPLFPHEVVTGQTASHVSDDDLWLAQTSKQLLDGNYPARPAQERFYAYRLQACRVGFGLPNLVDYRGIAAAIRRRFTPLFLRRIFGQGDENFISETVRLVFSANRARQTHPVAHLMCIEVLFDDLDGYFSAQSAATGKRRPHTRLNDLGSVANVAGARGIHRSIFLEALKAHGCEVMKYLDVHHPMTHEWVERSDRRWAGLRITQHQLIQRGLLTGSRLLEREDPAAARRYREGDDASNEAGLENSTRSDCASPMPATSPAVAQMARDLGRSIRRCSGVLDLHADD